MKNAIVVIGELKSVNLNTYKLGTRGYVTVNDTKLRVDFRKVNAAGNAWAGYEKAVSAVKEMAGKRVMVRGFVTDGSWAGEAGDVMVGQQLNATTFMLAPENVGEDRVLVQANMMAHQGRLFYAKHVGRGCLQWFGRVEGVKENLDDDVLTTVTMRRVKTYDDFGFAKKTWAIEKVDAATQDEFGMFTVSAIGEWETARPAYEEKLRKQAREQTAYRANH